MTSACSCPTSPVFLPAQCASTTAPGGKGLRMCWLLHWPGCLCAPRLSPGLVWELPDHSTAHLVEPVTSPPSCSPSIRGPAVLFPEDPLKPPQGHQHQALRTQVGARRAGRGTSGLAGPGQALCLITYNGFFQEAGCWPTNPRPPESLFLHERQNSTPASVYILIRVTNHFSPGDSKSVSMRILVHVPKTPWAGDPLVPSKLDGDSGH